MNAMVLARLGVAAATVVTVGVVLPSTSLAANGNATAPAKVRVDGVARTPSQALRAGARHFVAVDASTVVAFRSRQGANRFAQRHHQKRTKNQARMALTMEADFFYDYIPGCPSNCNPWWNYYNDCWVNLDGPNTGYLNLANVWWEYCNGGPANGRGPNDNIASVWGPGSGYQACLYQHWNYNRPPAPPGWSLSIGANQPFNLGEEFLNNASSLKVLAWHVSC